MRHSLKLLVIGLMLSVPRPADASAIVDTGTPVLGPLTGWSFYTGQYIAGQFTIADSYYLQTIEGYFGNQYSSSPGSVTIAIHSAGPDNNPGGVLYSSVVNLAAGVMFDWFGVSGSNYLLTPGTYWASFIPSAGIQGLQPGIAPLPLAEYAAGHDGSWYENPLNFRDSLGAGVRINADLAPSVPDETSTLGLLAGVSLLGLAMRLAGLRML